MASSDDKRNERDTKPELEDPAAPVRPETETVETTTDAPDRVDQEKAADEMQADTIGAASTEAVPDAEIVTDPPETPEAEGASSTEATPEAETVAAATETPEPAPERPAAPEREPERTAPAAAAPPAKRGGGFLGGLTGGVAAAAVGFGTAQYLEVDWLSLGGGEDPVAAALAEQNRVTEEQAATIAALEERIASVSETLANPDFSAVEETVTGLAGQIESEVGALSTGVVSQLGEVTESLTGLADAVSTVQGRLDGVEGSLGGLDGRMQAVTEQLGSVDERLVAVEKRPLVESSETARSAFEAYEGQVARLTAELEAQETESAETARRMAELAALTEEQITAVQQDAAERLAAMQADAEAQIAAAQQATSEQLAQAETTMRTAETSAAIVALEKALDEGAPYAEPLAVLGETAEVPEALASGAEIGVQSMEALAASYPAAARAALDASVLAVSAEDDPAGRLAAFIRQQTGARSLAPKEGNDPDAVLSRAEAALRSGDLAGALSEIDTLPEAGRAALAEWAEAARARRDAVASATALVASFPTN